MGNQGGGVVKAFIWKFLERFGVQGTQFVVQIILARLLLPEDYGILSLMVIFTTLANVFIQTGFNTALIQGKDVQEEDYSSVFWISTLIAVILYGVIFVAAPLIADFYEMENIVSPLRVLALMLIPGALNSVQLAKVSRELDFKKVFISNIGAVLVSGIAGVVLAYRGAGLWALVAQTILNVFSATLVMSFTVHWHPAFVCNLSRVKKLIQFGWKLLVSSLLDTLYQDLSSLIIGKKYSESILGYYNRGKQFPQFLMNAINSTVQSVMLPAMSAVQEHKLRVKTMMRHSISVSAYIVFPMMGGLAGVAEPLVRLLLTDKWLPCVPYLQVFCFSFAFYPVHSCNLQAINSLGRSDIFLKLEVIKKGYNTLALILVVALFDSPLAIAMTGLVTTWIGWFVNARPNKKLISYSYVEQVQDIIPSFLMSLTMFGCVFGIGQIALPIIPKLLVQVVSGIAIYLLLSVIFRPSPYRLLMDNIKRIIFGKKKV